MTSKVKIGDRAFFHAMKEADKHIQDKYIGKVGIVTEVMEDVSAREAHIRVNMVRIAYCSGSVLSILATEGFVTCRDDVSAEKWAEHVNPKEK